MALFAESARLLLSRSEPSSFTSDVSLGVVSSGILIGRSTSRILIESRIDD